MTSQSNSDLEGDMEVWAKACGPIEKADQTTWGAKAPIRTATSILDHASQLVGGIRAEQHGNKYKNFETVAEIWSAFISRACGVKIELKPWHVAMLMMLLKTARTLNGAYNEDDFDDLAGYAGIAGELADLDRE